MKKILTLMILAVAVASCGKDDTTVNVTSVSIDKITIDLNVGEDETLTATVAPENAGNKTVDWSSFSPEVATVDPAGKVTAIAAGTTTITATSQDGGKTSTCLVTVTAVYAVGDYYPNDTNPVGVVFRAKTSEISGLVVSLDEAERVWSSEGVPAGATSATNGLTNRTAVQSITNWQIKYPAFSWIYLKNNSNLTGPWYLPARGELVTLYAVFNGSSSTTANNTARTAFNTKLTSAGGTAINGADGPNDWYWSSTDTVAGGNAYEFSFFKGEQNMTANKLNSFLIRAVLAF